MAELRPSNRGLDLVRGFRSGAVACGIKRSGKPDLSLIVSQVDAAAAAAFTRNRAAAPPIQLCRRTIRQARHRAIVINSGNANCATGREGMKDAVHMAEAVAERIGCDARQVLVGSTGVIGVPLPMGKVEQGIAAAVVELEHPPYRAAQGIMTTDLVSKERAYRHADGYRIAGIAKGSGMIHPNMATMLACVCTDAGVSKDRLQAIVRRAVMRSFNRISVDNDESTNDACFVLANGASGVALRKKRELERFEAALTRMCQELAQDIVRDGEGASSFIAVTVRGARSEAEADRVAGAVCDSMLVKTAFAGRDPNWGRIVAAAGYSGAAFRLEKLRVTLNGVIIFSEGAGHDDQRRPFVDAKTGRRVDRKRLAQTMHKGDQSVVLDLGQGKAEATRWTCDLTHGYITINADYTT